MSDNWQPVASGDLQELVENTSAYELIPEGETGQLQIYWDTGIPLMDQALAAIAGDVTSLGGYTQNGVTVLPVEWGMAGEGQRSVAVWGALAPVVSFLARTALPKILSVLSWVLGIKLLADWELFKKVPEQVEQGLMKAPVLIALGVGAVLLISKRG